MSPEQAFMFYATLCLDTLYHFLNSEFSQSPPKFLLKVQNPAEKLTTL